MGSRSGADVPLPTGEKTLLEDARSSFGNGALAQKGVGQRTPARAAEAEPRTRRSLASTSLPHTGGTLGACPAHCLASELSDRCRAAHRAKCSRPPAAVPPFARQGHRSRGGWSSGLATRPGTGRRKGRSTALRQKGCVCSGWKWCFGAPQRLAPLRSSFSNLAITGTSVQVPAQRPGLGAGRRKRVGYDAGLERLLKIDVPPKVHRAPQSV